VWEPCESSHLALDTNTLCPHDWRSVSASVRAEPFVLGLREQVGMPQNAPGSSGGTQSMWQHHLSTLPLNSEIAARLRQATVAVVQAWRASTRKKDTRAPLLCWQPLGQQQHCCAWPHPHHLLNSDAWWRGKSNGKEKTTTNHVADMSTEKGLTTIDCLPTQNAQLPLP